MSGRSCRYEVVRNGEFGEWFVRFIARNGREVWRTSETYQRRGKAFNAIRVITGYAPRAYRDAFELEVPYALDSNGLIEVRLLEEES